MTTDTALIEKREELKRRLVAGEYKTLVDIFLEWIDRLIRKFTRRSVPLPTWYIIIFLTLVYYGSSFLLSYVEGNLENLNRFGDITSTGPLFVLLSGPVLVITSMVVINRYIHQIFILWKNDVFDATESITSLGGFGRWLELVCNWRLHLLVTISGGLLGGIYLTTLASNLAGVFMGYWYGFASVFLLLYFYALIYLVLIAVILSARLRGYEMKLFAADPSSSELISRLSALLGSMVYFIAVFAAFTTLVAAIMRLLLPLGMIVVLVLWLPIIILFVLNQTSLSTIIRRAKWKTLNEIQLKVEKLQTSKNFGNQETMDAIKRLMDYHDRVKATSDSALDFRTYLGFINSLLLPLLAFILGNLDLVLNLFTRKP